MSNSLLKNEVAPPFRAAPAGLKPGATTTAHEPTVEAQRAPCIFQQAAKKPGSRSVSRRKFLTSSALLAAAPALPRAVPVTAGATRGAVLAHPAGADASRKIPIGVFTSVYGRFSVDEMLDKVTALGLEAVEIGTSGYPSTPHCPVKEVLEDAAKARAWKKKFEDRNIRIGALSCHGNPIHPDPTRAQRDIDAFHRTVLLAERLEVPVVVGFSGCPAGSPTDRMPNWATYRWPTEFDQILKWQWSEKVIPYWREAAKFAREHGVHKLAFEMHPNFVVYNPLTLLKLRDAVGEEIGANCDLSHLFWQGCDAVEVIHLLGKQGALFHAHMKDTLMIGENVAKYGVLNFGFTKADLPQASAIFRAVGYGHSANYWKEIVKAYMDVGYQGILSIENEDPLLTGEVGVERATYVLKNVRAELLASA